MPHLFWVSSIFKDSTNAWILLIRPHLENLQQYLRPTAAAKILAIPYPKSIAHSLPNCTPHLSRTTFHSQTLPAALKDIDARSLGLQNHPLPVQNHIHAIEKERLEIELQRAESEKLERNIRKRQADNARHFRQSLADAFRLLEEVKREFPITLRENDDSLLRKTAALYANLYTLESLSQYASELPDITTLNRF